MTYKEQIVEISEILDSNCEGIPDTVCQEYCCSTCKATQIIGRGYRKQSEVAREIFAEIQKMVNRYWIYPDYGMPDMEAELAKLKKKYMEGSNGKT